MSSLDSRQRFDYFWLGFGLLFVSVGLLLEPGPEFVTLWGWPIPQVCLYQRFLDVSCLGCGLTRSTVYAIHGEIVLAFEHHVVGPILVAVVGGQTLYRLFKICE